MTLASNGVNLWAAWKQNKEALRHGKALVGYPTFPKLPSLWAASSPGPSAASIAATAFSAQPRSCDGGHACQLVEDVPFLLSHEPLN
jgi:hypothetical protein